MGRPGLEPGTPRAAEPAGGAAALPVLLEEALVAGAVQEIACGVVFGAGELPDAFVW